MKKPLTFGIVIVVICLATGIAVRSAMPTNSSPSQLAQEGWKLWQEQRWTEAITKFNQAVKLAPNDANAWNGLGWANFNSGKPQEAEQAFQKVISLQPNHPAALNGLGQIYLSRRKYDEAESYLLKAAPQAPAAWYGLTRLYLLEGKFDQAEKWAQNLADSGQADDLAKRMLQAAQAKRLSEGLRLMIQPPLPADQPRTEPAANPNEESAAVSAAQAWLALIDNGDYSGSWKAAAPFFQGAVTEQNWKSSMEAFRKPLGSLISRKLKSAERMTQMPGAPDGQYVVMQFDTSFANKTSAIETVTMGPKQDGKWKSSGYYIK